MTPVGSAKRCASGQEVCAFPLYFTRPPLSPWCMSAWDPPTPTTAAGAAAVMPPTSRSQAEVSDTVQRVEGAVEVAKRVLPLEDVDPAHVAAMAESALGAPLEAVIAEGKTHLSAAVRVCVRL